MNKTNEEMWNEYKRERLTWFSRTTEHHWLVQGMDEKHVKNCIKLLKVPNGRYAHHTNEWISSWVEIFEYELQRKKNGKLYEIN